MREIFYTEVPVPDPAAVCQWLHHGWQPPCGKKRLTPDGVGLYFDECDGELAIFTWSVQRTTYLKLFCWGGVWPSRCRQIQNHLQLELRSQFPLRYSNLPKIDPQESIFEALEPYFPKTTHFFRKFPKGEADLRRVYWWEKRWRERARCPQPTQEVIVNGQTKLPGKTDATPGNGHPLIEYDLIYIGGALGAIQAAAMARLGYRVLLVERLPFGRMNREWNIARDEFQSLLDLGLFTQGEFESTIAREYRDGFSKFFDDNNPPHLRAKVLHTPTVLNVALDSEKLLQLCGEKLRRAGGVIADETEFIQARVGNDGVQVHLRHLPSARERWVGGRLLVDAMGSASPIAWQLNGDRAFDSVCPTVGAVVAGFEPGVWDSQYGDVLNSHGDISRGRQLIWELFPARGEDLTIYLFHYHEVHPDNPGSLLEMYEDFFTILPEYRRCDPEKLIWRKATFGYIPGHFSVGSGDRVVAYDRLLALGDAASLQSPLVFTGFGSLVRNFGRVTTLLDTALRHDLLSHEDLNCIRAYQSNVAVTWLFSKGMMVPTGTQLPPQRIDAMLNTFFGLLAEEPPEVADRFIKDRVDWWTFNRLALKAAFLNPAIIPWIWQQAGVKDFIRWIGSYVSFTWDALVALAMGQWFPQWLRSLGWLESRFPRLWLRLLSWGYRLQEGLGQPRSQTSLSWRDQQ